MSRSKESIFFSSIRAFFITFAAILGIAVCIFLVALGVSFIPDQIKQPEKSELLLRPDADGNRTLLHETSPVILTIKMHGIVGERGFTTEKIKQLLLDAQEKLLKNGRIKGVMLDINTPGGHSTDSEGIFRTLKAFKAKYKLPIYAFVDGVCASGGMYIAAVADQIYATSSSIVGSIGVLLGPAFNFAKVMDKIGIEARTFTDGKGKDILNPFRPWKEGEDASIQALVEADYNRFVNHIIATRPRLDKDKLVNVYGAKIFDAQQGQEYGFIDVAGGDYVDALGALVKAAEIKAEEKYQVFEIKAPTSLLKEMLEAKTTLLKGKIVHTFETGSHFTPEMSGKLLYLYVF